MCAKESTLTKWTVAPIGTVVTGGMNPPLLPYAVAVKTDAVSETSRSSRSPRPDVPPAGHPAVQPARQQRDEEERVDSHTAIVGAA